VSDTTTQENFKLPVIKQNYTYKHIYLPKADNKKR